MILNLFFKILNLLVYFSKVFHVRSVTQGDVIRAEAKDIPRIFQVCELHKDQGYFWQILPFFL